jgi:hypothetical protein
LHQGDALNPEGAAAEGARSVFLLRQLAKKVQFL